MIQNVCLCSYGRTVIVNAADAWKEARRVSTTAGRKRDLIPFVFWVIPPQSAMRSALQQDLDLSELADVVIT